MPADQSGATEENTPESTAQADSAVNTVAPALSDVVLDVNDAVTDEHPTLRHRIKELVIGKPRDLEDKSIFTHISLIAFLAWVGLGADGLSSSCYGPAEAFLSLKGHEYLAMFLAAAIVATVFIISTCYSHIIEAFPSGGGGYLVATKLLGKRIGVVSGCALLVDYVLTITTSIAAAGDAVFGLAGPHWAAWKAPAEFGAIVLLIVLNLRGVKESVQFLMPIFIIFLITHTLVIVGSIVMHLSGAQALAAGISSSIHRDLVNPQIGLVGMLSALMYAYSMGAGTYTGLEAVSNSMPVMREPRVATGKRTMSYMAYSLSFMAGGLIIAYLLLGIKSEGEKTMNQILTEAFVNGLGMSGAVGAIFVFITLISEGLLLMVAAQAGFIDGPRVLANMAHDSWMPRWFSNLSERLATHNGVLLIGLAALGALIYTGGNVLTLLVMYSINVFLTFSLSMVGMCRHWWQLRGQDILWRRRLALFAIGAILCISILCVTIWEKFAEGGWRTLIVTGLCVVACLLIHRYYMQVGKRLKLLDETLCQLAPVGEPNLAEVDPAKPTAIILVGNYSGLGIHTMLNSVRIIPDYFHNFVFISVGVVDSGNFKGSSAVDELRTHTETALGRYVELGQRLGMPSTSYLSIGTDAVEQLEHLARAAARDFPHSLIFAGQLVFQHDTWWQRLLHNQTAYALQRRLQWTGIPMIILPTRVR